MGAASVNCLHCWCVKTHQSFEFPTWERTMITWCTNHSKKLSGRKMVSWEDWELNNQQINMAIICIIPLTCQTTSVVVWFVRVGTPQVSFLCGWPLCKCQNKLPRLCQSTYFVTTVGIPGDRPHLTYCHILPKFFRFVLKLWSRFRSRFDLTTTSGNFGKTTKRSQCSRAIARKEMVSVETGWFGSIEWLRLPEPEIGVFPFQDSSSLTLIFPSVRMWTVSNTFHSTKDVRKKWDVFVHPARLLASSNRRHFPDNCLPLGLRNRAIEYGKPDNGNSKPWNLAAPRSILSNWIPVAVVLLLYIGLKRRPFSRGASALDPKGHRTKMSWVISRFLFRGTYPLRAGHK